MISQKPRAANPEDDERYRKCSLNQLINHHVGGCTLLLLISKHIYVAQVTNNKCKLGEVLEMVTKSRIL